MASAVADEGPNDAVFEALWGRVLAEWDDERVHGAVLEHSVRAKLLPELAARYRALQDDEGKREVAKKRLDAIVVAATQMLMATQTPKPVKVPLSITLTAFAICLVLLGMLGWALWGRGTIGWPR
jgi:hypothetical protein